MINSALRAAVEHYAWRLAAADATDAVEHGVTEAMRTALLIAAEGLPH